MTRIAGAPSAVRAGGVPACLRGQGFFHPPQSEDDALTRGYVEHGHIGEGRASVINVMILHHDTTVPDPFRVLYGRRSGIERAVNKPAMADGAIEHGSRLQSRGRRFFDLFLEALIGYARAFRRFAARQTEVPKTA